MKKIILITFISLLTFVTVSHSKIYYFNKCYDDFKKNFSEMNMGQNSFIIDTEKKTVVNNQYRNDTNQSVTNKFNIEKIDNNIVRAINEKSKIFLINLTIFLTEKKVERSMFLYDTKTLSKTNVKHLFICE
jgi:hypothetical protein